MGWQLCNGKHLHSAATWPVVIAAAFFVAAILHNLRLTQHDPTPTSSRGHSVTAKGHGKNPEIKTLQILRRNWLAAADESGYTRQTFQRTLKNHLLLTLSSFTSLNTHLLWLPRLICTGCIRDVKTGR